MSASPASFPTASGLPQERRVKGRILYFVNDAPFFLSHRLSIARAARDSGMEVHVATPLDQVVVSIQGEGFSHHPVPISRWSANPLREIRSFWAIHRLLREVRPDILHNVTIKPVLYGSLAARLYTKKIAVVNAISGLGTVFIHRHHAAVFRRFIVKWLYRRLLRQGKVWTIFQNPDDYGTFIAEGIVKKDQSAMIRGSGVDLEHFAATPLPEGIPVVVLASRMLWDKGVGEFVRSAERLVAEGVSARFVLVGDSERNNPAAVPETRLNEWRRTGVIEWWGRQENMPEVFARAYIVCLPSYREGLPKVLIEAAACGRPLIATDVPGCREVVRGGVNGLLVPAREEEALGNAISELLKDRPRAEAMGASSRRIAEAEFGVETVVDQTLKLYEGLLQM